MKSPWHLGLLVLAVTGVLAYDFVYFKNYGSQDDASIQVNEAPLHAGTTASTLSPIQQPDSSDTAEGVIASRPVISRETIQGLAQQAYVPSKWRSAEVDTGWPRRDPFEEYEKPEQSVQSAPKRIRERHAASPLSLSIPQCIFSGTLIDQDRRLALVDGAPLSVGDRLGIWQLVRIEPDYLIFEAGKVAHRVELKGMGSKITRQENPL